MRSYSTPQRGTRYERNYQFERLTPVSDVDNDEYDIISENHSKSRNKSNHRHESRPAQPWPCRPCGLIMGISHILLGLCVIFFDVATNWITETVFAITAGICFVNSGILGLIAARKLDKGSIALFIVFSVLSLGLCIVLIIECSSILNQVCPGSTVPLSVSELTNVEMRKNKEDPLPSSSTCIHSVEARVRAGLLVLVLLEGVVGMVSVIVGIKSLCNRYAPEFEFPTSPYHALIYGDLEPPKPPKSIVQDIGYAQTSDGANDRKSYSRLVLQYLIESSPIHDSVINTEWLRRIS